MKQFKCQCDDNRKCCSKAGMRKEEAESVMHGDDKLLELKGRKERKEYEG